MSDGAPGIAGGMTDWSGVTTVHPIGLAALLVAVFVAMKSKRENLVLSVLFLIACIPSAQRIVVATLDFSFIRIIILVAIARMWTKGEGRHWYFGRADKVLLWWALWSIFAYGVLNGTLAASITRAGYVLEAFGAYIVGRSYIRGVEDIKRIVVFLGVLSIPILGFILVERSTGKNLFHLFGGVPEITLIREGRLRCQGPFSHPIMTGVFWAAILPWLWASWKSRYISRQVALASGVAIMAIIINCASSTPLVAVIASVAAFLFFPYRGRLRGLRWTTVLVLIGLHLVMKQPVWHLVSRLDLSAGSTGWHRFYLIDQAIHRFGEWWMFGTLSTAHWGNGLQDVTNHYILEGVRGGFIELFLFFKFIGAVFRINGKALSLSSSHAERLFLWGGGVALFVHCVNFIAVSYFGQLVAVFYLFAGATVSVAESVCKAAAHSEEASEVMGADCYRAPALEGG